MPRGTSYIHIEGIFDTEVLGTFRIIRGFASLKDLAAISVPVLMEEDGVSGQVQGHQRPLDEEHAEDLKRYFESGERRFVPEVILSIRVPLTEEIIDERVVGVNYNKDGVILNRKYESKNLPNHFLRIHKDSLDTLKAEKRIRRIDGNHRLAKAADLKDDVTRPHQYKAPVCFLLLGDLDDAAQDYTEALVFHTINSTAKSLDSEIALQLILGQAASQTQPAHLEFQFSPALHFTRLLDAGVRGLPEPHRSRLGGRPLNRLSIASKELLHTYPEKAETVESLTEFCGEIVAALPDVCTHLTADFPDFCSADYFIELATHVWMRPRPSDSHDQRLTETISYLGDMARWMGEYGMRELNIQEPLGRQLTKIYAAVVSRVPKKVFLARWYPKDEEAEQLTRAINRLRAIRQLVEDELGLELVDMGTQLGGTFPIHQKMYDEIEGSEIFIADLTGLRPSVMIELGYALKHLRSGRLLLIFNPISGIAEKVPFDTNNLRYETVGEAADIPAAIGSHVQEILESAKAGRI